MRRLTTALGLAAFLAGGLGSVPAAHAVTVGASFATFHGWMSADRRSGTTYSSCTEVVAGAVGAPFTCQVTFTTTKSICDIELAEQAGLAQYTSYRPPFSLRDIPLAGAFAGGQGVLQSGPIIHVVGDTVYVFEMTIDAHAVCIGQSPVPLRGDFQGKVSYL